MRENVFIARRVIIAGIILFCAFAGTPGHLLAQGGTEVLRGRVLGPDDKPIRGASVTIVGLQSKLERTTTTNASGVYTVLFSQPEGQYVVTVRAIGHAIMRQRVINEGEGNLLVTDFKMSRAESGATRLQTLEITANPKDNDSTAIGGDEYDILMDGALFSLDPSDLSTFMSNIPGVVYTPGEDGAPGTFSVLGVDEDENTITVDGMTTESPRVPSAAVERMSVATTSFDPSRGRFSGGMMSVRTRAGTNEHQARLEGSFLDPRLSWSSADYPLPPSGRQSFSAFASGPVIKNKLFYSSAYSFSRSNSEVYSALNLPGGLWTQYGMIRDTVNAVTEQLQSLGVPLTTPRLHRNKSSVTQSLFLRFDMNPTATTAMTVNVLGNIDRSNGSGISPTAYPAMGAGNTGSNLSIGLTAATTKGSILNEFMTAIKRRDDKSAPYLGLPSGSVLVSSQYGDNRVGLMSLRFGGGTSARSRSKDIDWETKNEISWLTADSRHRVKLGASLNVTQNSSTSSGNTFGTFTYQSLQNLVDNTPSSYSRQLSSRERSARAITGSISLGDRWRASDSWTFEYGVRLDWARSGTKPGYNPVVDSLFQRRTDQFPTNMGWSPRFGFFWRQGGRSIRGPAIRMSGGRYGAMPLDLARGLRQLTVSGGIGAFRNVINPGMIASLVDATGLPNTVRSLNCVGAATPIPMWEQYAANQGAIPDRCLDGTAPSEFSTSSPSVLLYDPGFNAPLNWRGNIDIHGITMRGWGLSLNLTMQRGYYGQSTMDLNLRRSAAFTLNDEGGRPVYVDPSAIVPASGAIAPGASRLHSDFVRVSNTLSDLRSTATSVRATFSRLQPFFNLIPVTVSYTLANNRSQFRGGAVGLDPWAKEWATGTMPTHSITFNTYFNIKWFTVHGGMTLTSGSRYTPVVGGDVNGDGMPGDRAFVFDPNMTADPALAADMRALLQGMPKLARECLQQSLGRLAGLNSCRTGWQIRPNINFGIIDPTRALSVNDRLRFTLITQNAFSALARIFGVSQSFLGRSGLVAPDPTLLYIDGFDPTTRRYKYRVNQQFGDVRKNAISRSSILPPFQVGLRGDWRIGGPARRTFGQSMGIVPVGDQPPLTREQIFERLERQTANPLVQVLELQDSLLLTESQVRTLQAASHELDVAIRELMEPIVDYVEREGKDTQDRELMKRIGKARSEVQSAMLSKMKQLNTLLNDEQKDLLPRRVQALLAAGKAG